MGVTVVVASSELFASFASATSLLTDTEEDFTPALMFVTVTLNSTLA